MSRLVTPADVLPVAVAAGLVVPLDSVKTMPRRTVSGALTFTVGATANGGQCVLPIVADGVSAVTFQGFTEAGFSAGFNNTAGILNMVQFFYLDGTPYFAVSQAVNAQPIVAPATAYSLSGPSTGTVGVASSNYTLRTNGGTSSAVTFTPSDGGKGGTFTPSTVQIGAASGATSATFTYTPAAAGSVSIGVTDNGGLTDPSPIAVTVAAAATRNYIRLIAGSTDAITESVDANGGYDYTAPNPNNYGGPFGVSTKSLAANTDGYFAIVNQQIVASGVLFGFVLSQAMSSYGDAKYGVYSDTQADTNYKYLGNPSSSVATVMAAGDILRVNRSGSTITIQCSKDNGATFTAIATWNNASTAQLWGGYNLGNKTYALKQPFASSNVA
jgi:hypothetical protein